MRGNEYCIINDSDILVSPHYLARVMALRVLPAAKSAWSQRRTGRTAPDGQADHVVAAGSAGHLDRLYAGVLTARRWKAASASASGRRWPFGATRSSRGGGLEPLLEYLADDYEMGAASPRPDTASSSAASRWKPAVAAYTSAASGTIKCAGRAPRAIRGARISRPRRHLRFPGRCSTASPAAWRCGASPC